jgi:L-amino acid N-acyltransferase YncA
MEIRAAQVTDLARIDQIYNEGLQLALQGEGATHPVRLWQVLTRTLSSLLPVATPSELLFVLDDDGKVMGFIQGEILTLGGLRRPRPTAVRVLNLSLAPELASTGGGALIDHLCNAALELGIARVYVRIPEGHAVVESFRAHGFQHYASDRVFYAEALPAGLSTNLVDGLRPSSRRDLLGLFTLYLASTPKAVSQMEAPDFDQWRAVYDSEWLGRFGRRPAVSLVVDRGEIVGWLGVEPASPGRPHTVMLAARGDASPHGEIQAELLGEAGRRLAPRAPGPVWCNVRNYDTVTTRILQEAGFTALAEQELLVREMRTRAAQRAPQKQKKEKALAPAFT